MREMETTAMTSLTRADITAAETPSPPPARIGVTTRRGTTMRSWSRSTPKDDLPNFVPIWSPSLRSCSTKAELDRARAPPRTTDAAPLTLKAWCATAYMTAAVAPNCNPPRPKTSRRMATKVLKLRWIPISKRNSTTPRSARSSVLCRSCTRFSPLGPSATPAARKPRMGEAPRTRLQRGALNAVAPRRRRASLRPPTVSCFRLLRAAFTIPKISTDLETAAAAGAAADASPPRGTASHARDRAALLRRSGSWRVGRAASQERKSAAPVTRIFV
mmetsp:Transcript_26672/g.53169  ORF Transcript_26672/g.53169 Transcript_26672/m.53169 type:complete len:274 (-) Transcript_26672:113-934(-)